MSSAASAMRGAVALGSVVIGTSLGAGLEQRRMNDARAGWNLVPLAVATQDIRAGGRVEVSRRAERALPQILATSSVLTAAEAARHDFEPLLFNVEPGQPLTHALFPSTWDVPTCLASCAQAQAADEKAGKD
jgi:hypothetical protein